MGVRIITVDDDINILKSVEELLALRRHEVHPHLSGADALAKLEAIKPHMAIVDFYMPDGTGVDLMKRLHEKDPALPVIILTASRDVNDAVEAIKAGAYHYLTKPIQPDELYSIVDKIAEGIALKEENRRLKEELNIRYRFDNVIGRSGALEEVFAVLDKAVRTKSTILITGESGTGKELIARAAHYNSSRASGPFVKVHCAAIPESMLEAELFGIEKNTATGVAQRPGKFEMADGGTIFLDEIGEMPAAMQVKLLRVLQEREVDRIGSIRPKKIDVRVIAATNIDIARAVADKRFREDLFYRLNVFHIHVPPLARRKADIPLLVEHFVKKYCDENGLPMKDVEPRAMDWLVARPWPGNIRELENVIERAVGVSDGGAIEIADVADSYVVPTSPVSANISTAPPAADDGPPPAASNGKNIDDRVAEFERRILLDALERNRWKQNKTAEELGISERSIWYKVKKLGIDVKKPEA